MAVDEIKRSGRATQGVIVVRLRDGEKVSSLAPVADSATTVEGVVGEPAEQPSD